MFNLLTSPRTARTVRGLYATARDAVRSVVAPAALVQKLDTEAPAPAEAADPADVYTDDEMPSVEEIGRAALTYDLSCDNARRADRGKRAAKRILTRLPSSTYGAWKISRKPSARQVIDANAVAATYKKLGLGPVPLKPCADSLVVERIAIPAELAEVAA